MRLTNLQTELLRLMYTTGPRYGIRDRRVVMALERKGLARYYPVANAFDVTAKGKRLGKRLFVKHAST